MLTASHISWNPSFGKTKNSSHIIHELQASSSPNDSKKVLDISPKPAI